MKKNKIIILAIIAMVLIIASEVKIKTYEDGSFNVSGCFISAGCNSLYNAESGTRENKTINKIKIRTLRFFWNLCDFQTIVKCGSGVNAETNIFNFILIIGDKSFNFTAINNYPFN